MVDVYYYVPAGNVNEAVECGLKLSVWFDKEVLIEGELKKCFSGLLNPKDDLEKYNSDKLKCVKLEVPKEYCFVGDKYLYLVGLKYPDVMDLYIKSIIPVEKYTFGSYRLPECLVTCTVIGGHISLLDKRIDLPVLFDSSEELYINNIMEILKEEHKNFYDTLLYYFYCRLAEMQKIDTIEDDERKTAVFVNRGDGRVIIVKVPDK